MKFLFLLLLVLSTCFCSASDNPKADAEITKVLLLMDQPITTNTIKLLVAAEKKYPYHSANYEVLFQLAVAYMEMNQYQQASASFDLFLKRYGKYDETNPRVDQCHIAKAKILANQDLDAGIKVLLHFLKTKKKSKARSEALCELAVMYTNKGDYEMVKKCLKPIIKSPKNFYKQYAKELLAESQRRATNICINTTISTNKTEVKK